MNSALKPVLPQPGVPQPGGQASPAKANVANANHAVGLPQGAQNSMHHGTNNLVGQNLTHHAPAPPAPAHPVPSMAPVTANMAQMAQNMSHHGNLSHVTQNSVTPTNVAASPNKSASTSATGPLSLVADKPQPLALTRTPEKKDSETPGQSNGTVESPKSASNAPAALKPQNPEPNKEKQDIAKTSPSTPKPPEKPTSAPTTPQKSEPAVPVSTTDGASQPKVATANEAPEKSPSKPVELKPAPTADVAPTQSDSKPVPESANDSQLQEKAPTPQKSSDAPAEAAKAESPAKPEEKKEEPKPEKPAPNGTEEKEPKEEAKVEKKEEVKSEPPKKEESVEKEPQKPQKPEEKQEEKKPETKTPAKESKAAKSTIKLATVTPPMRKRRQTSPKPSEGPTPAKKAALEGEASTPDSRIKRNRTQVQLYQSPTPELAMATKLSASAGRSTPTKPNDDKLIVFYKNEYLAVRNAEGGFYVCQTTQNVYRTTRKIKIRWLSQDKSDPSGETYKPDFYDVTDMECVLTTLSLKRVEGGGGAQILKPAEEARAKSILERALKAEQSGANNMELTEEHPDGLDLSLYTDESQLEKKTKSRKRTSSKSSPRTKQESASETADAATPAKKARTTPKRSPKSGRKTKVTPPKQNNKRKSAGSTPIMASTSKVGIVQRIYRNTATAVTEKAKGKSTPKRTPAKAKVEKVEKPVPATTSSTRKGRRSAAKVDKPAPVTPVPSTSTGKTTRTPRKPPAKK
ncbi:proteoglycan 4-like isoform X2 [Pectinophora gossypiella]|uniref:proteoglycan 4-like isoform X2 n=1 Tax=Pectinophora gossypiella TaxID=13191 RepID=UPI00214E9180|nr:proteoglycan 4-like isoform X2 [Pectinophora gossypiella]